MRQKKKRRMRRNLARPGPKKKLLLVLLLMDNSSSIQVCGNVNAVLRGSEVFLEEIGKSTEDVRVKIVRFHDRPQKAGFLPVKLVRALTRDTFPTYRGTPFYNCMFTELQSLNRLVRKYSRKGYIVQTITVLFADGQNNRPGKDAGDVRKIVDAMKKEGSHIFAARGVNYGAVNFHTIFQGVGIDRHQIEVLAGGHEFVANMASTGGGIAAASTDDGGFRAATVRGLGNTTGQAQ